MRIGVDCRLSGPQHAGIGRYIANLITRLPTLDSKTTWIYFVADRKQAAAVAELPNVEIIVASVRHYSFLEQAVMPGFFQKANLDLLHVPHFNVALGYKGPLIITIHDLLWHEYKGRKVTTLSTGMYWLKYWAYRWVSTQAIERAQTILVPAKIIQKTITKYYPQVENKVVVTYEGVSGDFLNRGSRKKMAEKLPKDKKVLLYVGSLYPHKNVGLVIQAMKGLPDYHLVIVGARTVFQTQMQQTAKKHKVSSSVSFFGYLDDKDLAALMASATALVQPSLSEGFGLTGIEAMAASLPVIASNIPVFEEIYGKAAIFFDPYSLPSFIEAVKTLDSSDRQKLILEGQTQSHKYSWDTMAKQTLREYHKLLAE